MGFEEMYALQEVDGERSRLQAGLESSDEQQAEIEANEQLTKVRTIRHRLISKKDDLSKKLRRLELDLETSEDEIRKLQQSIYGGEIQNTKELNGLQNRLKSQEARKDRLEEEVIQSMEAIEELAAKEKQVDRAERQAKKRVEEASKVRRAADERRRSRLDELDRERTHLIEQLPTGLLKKYESLYKRFAGRPVARVTGGTCSGCHVGLPTSAGPATTDRCPNCGRLLWWPSA